MYLIDASRSPERVTHDICQMPDGVFVDRLSTFTDAAFVADDSMVVAARHTYVCLWRTNTGLPLRVLQSSVSPVRRLLTCDIVNMAVTVLADSTMQVTSWCCTKEYTLNVTTGHLRNIGGTYFVSDVSVQHTKVA